MTTPSTTAAIPDYVAGTWNIDPVHSEVGFSARHMMVSKVRGRFTTFSGQIVTGADPLGSTVSAEIDLASITTGNDQRDDHIRSADFFEVETYPKMTYRSTGVRVDGDDYVLDGELTLKDVTKSVPLTLELNGFGPDPFGGTRAGFTATGEINRKDFNVNFSAPMQNGGVVVSDKIGLHLEIEAVLKGRPSKGPLFPRLRTARSSDRAIEFKQRCRGLGIEGVTLIDAKDDFMAHTPGVSPGMSEALVQFELLLHQRILDFGSGNRSRHSSVCLSCGLGLAQIQRLQAIAQPGERIKILAPRPEVPPG